METIIVTPKEYDKLTAFIRHIDLHPDTRLYGCKLICDCGVYVLPTHVVYILHHYDFTEPISVYVFEGRVELHKPDIGYITQQINWILT